MYLYHNIIYLNFLRNLQIKKIQRQIIHSLSLVNPALKSVAKHIVAFRIAEKEELIRFDSSLQLQNYTAYATLLY
jgi:hypothetical protein